jgi:signal transduction histidine kinase
MLVKDLIDRMEEYKSEPNEEILEDIADIISDMELNLTKIKEHSIRLDKIVKNMQIHSNDRANEFALIDINSIVNEYTKLAYYGLRSANPMLNIQLIYNLDESIGEIYAVPNNMSRVIINIVSNACFATNSRLQKNTDDNYLPEVIVSTTNLDDNYIEIKVRDNGEGIPEENINKIFTPFFTTKSAGEGTGLGLSMCYEIITKEHKGEIICNSQLDVYTEFIIKLPKKNF